MEFDNRMDERTTIEADGEHEYVTATGPHDVLLGRGAPFLNYEGNKRFREFVRTKRSSYKLAMSATEKNAIAQEIVDDMARRGGRFLMLANDVAANARMGLPPDTRLWRVVADDKAVLFKCKQTLRDKDMSTTTKRAGRAASAKKDTKNATRPRLDASCVAEPCQPHTGGSIPTALRVSDTAQQRGLGGVNPDQYNGDGNTTTLLQGISSTHPLLVSSSIPVAISTTIPASNLPLPSTSMPLSYNTVASVPIHNFNMVDWQQAVQVYQQQHYQARQLQAIGQFFLASGQYQARQLEQNLQASLAAAAATFGQSPLQQLPPTAFPSHIVVPSSAGMQQPLSNNQSIASSSSSSSSSSQSYQQQGHAHLDTIPDGRSQNNDELMNNIPQHVEFQPALTVPDTNLNAATTPWPAVPNAETSTDSTARTLPPLVPANTSAPPTNTFRPVKYQPSLASQETNLCASIVGDPSASLVASDQSTSRLYRSGRRETNHGGAIQPLDVTATGVLSENDGLSDDPKPSSLREHKCASSSLLGESTRQRSRESLPGDSNCSGDYREG
jgi:hypothetical protein